MASVTGSGTAGTAGSDPAGPGPPASLADRVAVVRAFNRAYTRTIGLLQEGLLDTRYSLTEARVLFELAQSPATELVDLRRELGLDAGYVSRMLTRFASDGLVERQRSDQDARRQVVALTEAGRAVFRSLDERSAGEVAALLGGLAEDDQRRLLAAMDTIGGIVHRDDAGAPVVIRAPREGDLGWVVERHGALYAQEHGWDASFEHFVIEIMAEYVAAGDDARQAAWIADIAGRRVGCMFCTPLDERVAQLRLFLVEPAARGRGLGTRLVDECLAFARRARYERITLWTYDTLADARRVYQRAGFTLVAEHPEERFGRRLVGQRWERGLHPAVSGDVPPPEAAV